MAWHEHTLDSRALRGNPLGDPHERPLWVWSPEGDGPYPSVYVIQGMTGMVGAWFNTEPWSESYATRIDELAPEAIVVLVDAFTAVGGSQFLDSEGIGNYHTYLCEEVVPFVDATYPTADAREHRGIQGKSSGGYGAMITPFLRPDLFGGLATHAGDALFEVCYARDFAPAARALRERYHGSFEEFWQDFRSRPPLSGPYDELLVNTYAMAAAYSNNELPFDLETGELDPDVWARWLEWDPVMRARQPEGREVLRGMQAIWIDSGRFDEYHLELCAAAFHREVAAAGTPAENVHFELFEGTHRGLTWRYPLSLAFLVGRLSSTL